MNIGVIFAGGVGSRMHSKDIPKQFLEIYNKPIMIHTLEHFEACPDIDAICVVCVRDWIGHLQDLIDLGKAHTGLLADLLRLNHFFDLLRFNH